MGEPERPGDDSLRSQLIAEDEYMLRLVDTVHPKYYFDADTVEALTEEINSKVEGRAQGVKKAHKMARLDPSLYRTVSQLLQANQPTSKKRRKAKATLHSAALDRATSLDELRHRLSNKIEALRGSRPVRGERKAAKRAAKPPSKPTPAKLPKSGQDSGAVVAKKKKARKVPQQPPAVFNRDGRMVFSKFELADSVAAMTEPQPKPTKKQKLVRQLEAKVEKMKNLEECDPERAKQVQEKEKWHRALDRAEGIKVKDDPELLKASLKRHEKRRKQSRQKWQSRTEHVQQQQQERQQKRRDNIKARKQAKLQTKMKRLKKRGHIVPGF